MTCRLGATVRRSRLRGKYDHTTGLINRRELGRILNAAVPGLRGKRVLLLLDLDHFKKVNDLSGHAAGDEVLEHVARSLQFLSPEGSCAHV